MPSSLTKVISRTLVFSTRLPVSVCGTGTYGAPCEAFLGGRPTRLRTVSRPRLGQALGRMADLPATPRPVPFPGSSIARCALPPASLLRYGRPIHGSGMLTGCPSPTPLGLGLGPTDPEPTNVAQGTLRLSVGGIPTPLIATYSSILSSRRSSTPCGMPSTPRERSPTTPGIASGDPRLRQHA